MDNPKYQIITYGCQMNKSDSERLAAILRSIGFAETEMTEEADLVLINTCSVRQSAEDRVWGQLRRLGRLKQEKPNLMVGITGCLPGRDRDGAIKKKLPETVDFYFPIHEMVQLPRWIHGLRPELVDGQDLATDYLKIQPSYHNDFQAFIPIQTGCNNFCTYCVVPFARGLEKNRPVADIMKDVRERAARGVVEITLLGQTVNSYLAPDPESFSETNPFKNHFAKLLWEVNQVPGVKRLHFTAPHPRDFDDEVIQAMGLPAHINFLHLPVQSGDNEVLRRMNRKHTVEDFEDAVRRVRAKIPNIALGTDLIVGFCGETEAQFQKTVDLFKRMKFDMSYHAMYSQRSGTAAAKAFKDDVSPEEKRRRWNIIQELLKDTVYELNQKYVGQTLSVLVERCEDVIDHEQVQKMCYGFSRELKLTRFPGDESLVGKIVDVKIKRADKWLLEGEYESA